MRSDAKDGLQVLRRVRDFLAGGEVTTALGSVAKHVEGLSAVIGRLSTFAVEQDGSARAFSAGTRTVRELSRALRRGFMRPVSLLGKSLFPNDDSIRQALRMPLAQDYEGLIAAALAMADRAAENKDRFVAAGFGEDFVERVRLAAEHLRKALDARAGHLGTRSGASAGLREQLARGRDLVRLLDTMLTHEWADDPERLAKWQTLARFARTKTPDEPVVPGAPGSTPSVPESATGGVRPSTTQQDVQPINTPFTAAVVPSAVSGDAAAKAA